MLHMLVAISSELTSVLSLDGLEHEKRHLFDGLSYFLYGQQQPYRAHSGK